VDADPATRADDQHPVARPDPGLLATGVERRADRVGADRRLEIGDLRQDKAVATSDPTSTTSSATSWPGIRGNAVTRPGTAAMMTTVRPTPVARTRRSASPGADRRDGHLLEPQRAAALAEHHGPHRPALPRRMRRA
jgi:hypothetical protein